MDAAKARDQYIRTIYQDERVLARYLNFSEPVVESIVPVIEDHEVVNAVHPNRRRLIDSLMDKTQQTVRNIEENFLTLEEILLCFKEYETWHNGVEKSDESPPPSISGKATVPFPNYNENFVVNFAMLGLNRYLSKTEEVRVRLPELFNFSRWASKDNYNIKKGVINLVGHLNENLEAERRCCLWRCRTRCWQRGKNVGVIPRGP